MSLSWTFEECEKVLLVTAKGGNATDAEVMEFSFDCINEAKKRGKELLLCDEREMCHKISVVDAYEKAKKIGEQTRFLHKACIVISPSESIDPIALNVWEDTLNSMGNWARAFRDIDEAWKWIKE